ncbi:MAG: polyamine ABC transporter ATP-binding protein [Planctomycetota bacterium]|nr:MAG: polyamine ABC transporter ATP-binding protein [Planctomycetota bacterium]
MAAVITADHLTIGWGDFVLMKELCFEIEEGDIFVILGGSGCGKSTLLRNIVGLEQPMGGTISVLGKQPHEHETPPYGVMFQSGALFGSMSLLDNVQLPLQKWTDLDAGAIEDVARARLRLVALDGYEHFMPSELSGGMKKRAGIARALALEPRLLLLDEPSAGLDPISAVELDDLILTLSGNLGVTTVMVTHELPSVFKVARRCIMLDKQAQAIIADGDPHLLKDSEDPRVHRFFNREPSTGAAS